MNKIDEIVKTDYLTTKLKQSPIKWKKLGFTMLPNGLAFDPRITKGAMLVYWVLTLHLFRGKDYCFPSIRTIEKEAHLSRPTVIMAIRILQDLGYLEVDKTKGKVSKYYLRANPK